MNLIYIVLALFVSFLWGIQPVIHKYLMEHISYVSIILLSGLVFTVGIVGVAIYDRHTLVKDYQKLTMELFLIIIASSVMCVFISSLLYYYLLKRHNSAVVSSLVYSCPIFSLAAAYFILNEEIDIYGIAGVLLIVAGVFCMAFNNNKNAVHKTG